MCHTRGSPKKLSLVKNLRSQLPGGGMTPERNVTSLTYRTPNIERSKRAYAGFWRDEVFDCWYWDDGI